MDLKDQQAEEWLKSQMSDHINSLEKEIEKQDLLIKLLVQALFLTYGEK